MYIEVAQITNILVFVVLLILQPAKTQNAGTMSKTAKAKLEKEKKCEDSTGQDASDDSEIQFMSLKNKNTSAKKVRTLTRS